MRQAPPHSEKLEGITLGCIMLAPTLYADGGSLLDDVAAIIQAEDFYVPRNRAIFEALMELRRDGSTLTLPMVAERMKRNNADFDGLVYLASLVDGVVSTEDAIDFAKVIRDKAHLRRLQCSLNAGLQAIEEGEGPQEVAEACQRACYDILAGLEGAASHSVMARDLSCEIMMRTLERVERYRNGVEDDGMIVTGLTDVDRLLYMKPQDLIVIAARPSIGKTAFALSLVAKNASRQSIGPLFFYSLEMSREALGVRFISTSSGMDSRKIEKGAMTNVDIEGMKHHAALFGDLELCIDDTSSITLSGMRNHATRLSSRLSRKPGALIVDYLGLMGNDSGKKNASRQEEVAAISKGLKGLAKDFGCPVIALVQLNRDSEKENRAPRLHDLRESGAIEQDADAVVFLHRERKDTSEDPAAKIPTDVIIAKQRNGPVGTVKVLYQPSCGRWLNFQKPERL